MSAPLQHACAGHNIQLRCPVFLSWELSTYPHPESRTLPTPAKTLNGFFMAERYALLSNINRSSSMAKMAVDNLTMSWGISPAACVVRTPIRRTDQGSERSTFDRYLKATYVSHALLQPDGRYNNIPMVWLRFPCLLYHSLTQPGTGDSALLGRNSGPDRCRV
jgi:hypothetical protein